MFMSVSFKHSSVLQILQEKFGSPLLNITETICGVPTALKYSRHIARTS